MKKILAILLSTAMLVAMFAVMAVPTSAAAQSVSATFDTTDASGAVALLFNETDNAGAWWLHVSFKPTSTAGQYEVVEVANPEGTNAGVSALAVPTDGFVWGIYCWPGEGAATADLAIAKTLTVGSIVAFNGIDVAAGTASNVTVEVISIAAKPADIAIENNVAYGKSYTTSAVYKPGADWAHDPSATPAYPDEEGSLTDGYLPTAKAYSDVAWAGLHDGIEDAAAAGYSFVNVDFAGTYALNKVVAYVTPELNDGVSTPDWLAFVAIDAEGNETVIAEITSFPTAADTDAYIAVESNCDVVADKLAVRMATGGGYTMIAEVAAYGVEGEYPAEGETSNEESNEVSNEESNEVSNEESNEVSNEESNEVSNEESNVEEEITIEDLMGPVNEDAAFTVDIVAPETYVAGETFSIDVVINGITNADGFDTFELVLEYDQDKLELAETLNGSAISVFNGFAEWEDLTVVNEDGTIAISAGTAGGDNGNTFTFAKNDGEISFTIDFTAKADATGDALIYICNECPMGYYTDGGVEAQGNGDYAVIAEGVPATEPAPATDDPAAGDATSMIFFAIIALVAIAGSAVVIKTRR